MPPRWTLERFLERAVEIHGDKFDYSKVTRDHIKGAKSKTPLSCRDCGYEWDPTIDTHINKKGGCPNCSGRVKWTLDRFLEKAHEIHGDNYDYSEITEDHIKNCKSTIPLSCLTCGYMWETSIISHINRKSGCRDCAGNAKWTLDRFLEKARGVHGDKYDYSQVTREKITNAFSKIPIICLTCDYFWEVSVNNHINHKRGCPNCAQLVKYTLDRFIEKAREIHGDKYDYTGINEEHIKGTKSSVPLICRTCNYSWETSITSHITQQTGCPSCSGVAKYTLDRFLNRATRIHGDKYDYSKVTEEHIKGHHSKIPVTCRSCNHLWEVSINNHINGKYGCPNCSGLVKYTLERFLRKVREIHGNLFDYSQIVEGHIENNKSKVPIICNGCRYQWSPSINEHITRRSGCPACKASRGERECRRILEECGLEYQKEVIIPELPRKRYDFAFCYEDHLYLLEFDGIQHFEENTFHHRHEGAFKERQDIDLIKTKVALERGATLIRIDYTQIDNIYDHICRAIEEGNNLYLSTPKMYTYITDRL